MAFKIAGSMAFKQAVADADAYLLEPIMQVTIAVPEDTVGDVIGDLNSPAASRLEWSRRGRRRRSRPRCRWPKCSTTRRPARRRPGDYTMEFLRYEEVPGHIAQKVVAEAKAGDEQGVKA